MCTQNRPKQVHAVIIPLAFKVVHIGLRAKISGGSWGGIRYPLYFQRHINLICTIIKTSASFQNSQPCPIVLSCTCCKQCIVTPKALCNKRYCFIADTGLKSDMKEECKYCRSHAGAKCSCASSVCLKNFSHFHFLQNQWVNFNQTRRICKEDSSFIKILLNGDNRGKAKIHIY